MEKSVREQIMECSAPYSHKRNTAHLPHVLGWVIYMGRTYGGTCHPKADSGVSTQTLHLGYDWGQALMHAQFGPNWMEHSQRDDLPDSESWEIALAWAEGEWPEWAEKPVEDAS